VFGKIEVVMPWPLEMLNGGFGAASSRKVTNGVPEPASSLSCHLRPSLDGGEMVSGGEAKRQHLRVYFSAVVGALACVAWWAYSPSLPPEMLIPRYSNSASRFIDVDGARAHVREQGNPRGIPMVLIHGASASLHVWDGWASALGDKARLISVDLPGHGLTGSWPRGEYTAEAYADFVESLVGALKLDRFVLVGHSLGGGIAWYFASTRPGRVSQLILVDSAGYPPEVEVRWPARLARLPLVGDLGIYFKPQLWVRRTLLEAYADPSMVTDELVKRTAELQRFPGNQEATLERARTQEALDPAPLKHLEVPTLILWGRKDQWVPVENAIRFQRDIKGARLAVFDNLGHDVMEEDPKASVAPVSDFLKPIVPQSKPARDEAPRYGRAPDNQPPRTSHSK
jgi:pimeloyl-ACP methyl ester carboxylesterase